MLASDSHIVCELHLEVWLCPGSIFGKNISQIVLQYSSISRRIMSGCLHFEVLEAMEEHCLNPWVIIQFCHYLLILMAFELSQFSYLDIKNYCFHKINACFSFDLAVFWILGPLAILKMTNEIFKSIFLNSWIKNSL